MRCYIDYIEQPYLIVKTTPKKEKEVIQFKFFEEMLNKRQVNIPFCEALERMPVYAKFMKEKLLSRKRKLKHDKKKRFGGRVQCNHLEVGLLFLVKFVH